MLWLNLVAVPLIARICLVVLFPFSAADKVVHWNAAMKQATSSVPAGAARLMLVVAIVVETLTPICIVIGWHDRLAAFILAGFCVVTGVLYHQFWRFRGFWTPDTEGNAHFWEFLKNFGLVGGLLLVVIGLQLAPVSAVVEHPLTSAPFSATPGPLH